MSRTDICKMRRI